MICHFSLQQLGCASQQPFSAERQGATAQDPDSPAHVVAVLVFLTRSTVTASSMWRLISCGLSPNENGKTLVRREWNLSLIKTLLQPVNQVQAPCCCSLERKLSKAHFRHSAQYKIGPKGQTMLGLKMSPSLKAHAYTALGKDCKTRCTAWLWTSLDRLSSHIGFADYENIQDDILPPPPNSVPNSVATTGDIVMMSSIVLDS